MGCYSEEAKTLASLFAARKLRAWAIGYRINALKTALEQAEKDVAETAAALLSEAGQDHNYLVGQRFVEVVTRPSRRGVYLQSPTIAPEGVEAGPLAISITANDDDLPARAIKLVASK